MFASLIDPSVIKKSEIMYLAVDIDHGPNYGHTVVRRRIMFPVFFCLTAARRRPIVKIASSPGVSCAPSSRKRTKWSGCEAVRGHLRSPEESIFEGQGARGEKLRIFAVEPAKGLTGADLAARESHGLKGALIAEFWLTVWLLRGAGTIAWNFFFAIILLGHKPSPSARRPSRSSRRLGRQTFCSVPPTSPEGCCHL